MTNAEKASILNGLKSAAYGDSHNGYYVGNTLGVKRLGVPSMNMQDASQGFRTIDASQYGQVTSWPCSLAVAANWDANATEEWGKALGVEFRAKGANMILGPSLNVHRVARGGRNAEYISGEDPFLGSAQVAAYVRGVQSEKVVANIKHYILNNQETNRNGVNSIVSERALQEIYMAPFRAGVRAGVASAMCSYNLVNGTHACDVASSMNRNLKGDLQWPGFITSDWAAVHDDGYQNAGLDMDQPGTDGYFAASKLVGDNATLNDMATRVIGALIDVGALDDPVCVPTGAGECDHYLYEANATSPEHAEMARSLAANGASLLKNENQTLPLKPGSTIAVVGSACDAPYDLSKLGGWNQGNYYVMGGSGRVINPDSTSILTGLKARAAAATPPATIVSDVTGADVIVTCGATWSSEGGDRRNLLIDQQNEVYNIVTAAGKAGTPVVVLLTAPGAIVTSQYVDGADAMVAMFLAGQATGLAWADVLFGDVNPNGKLPVTFPVSEDDVVEPCTSTDCTYTEGLAVGYRAFQQDSRPVAFPFGHGLSYTTFTFSKAVVTAKGGDCDATVCIDVVVTNNGTTPGAEVAQLYLTYPASAEEPGSPLRGFMKTKILAAKATQTIRFKLQDDDVSVWDSTTHSFRVVKGEAFTAHIGSSSMDWHRNLTFTV
jgi:beta-glucosidase